MVIPDCGRARFFYRWPRTRATITRITTRTTTAALTRDKSLILFPSRSQSLVTFGRSGKFFPLRAHGSHDATPEQNSFVPEKTVKKRTDKPHLPKGFCHFSKPASSQEVNAKESQAQR
jgi:hypothetical protein